MVSSLISTTCSSITSPTVSFENKKIKTNVSTSLPYIFHASDIPSVIVAFLNIKEMYRAFSLCSTFYKAKGLAIKNLAERTTKLNDEDVLRLAPVFGIFPTPEQQVFRTFPSTEQVGLLMNNLPNLTAILLTERTVSYPLLFKQIEGVHKNVTALSLCNVDGLFMREIDLIPKRYPRLQHLIVTFDHIAHFNWLIPLLPQLQSLTCNLKGLEDIHTMDPLLKQGFPELRVLDIENNVKDYTETFLLNIVKACPKLSELMLLRYPVTPSTVKQLLKASPKLQLEVFFLLPTEEGLSDLGTAGGSLSRITALKIEGYTIEEENSNRDVSFRSIFLATPSNSASSLAKLSKLELCDMSLPYATLAWLSGYIKQLREFRFDRVYDESSNNDIFSKSIAQFIQANPHLHTLVLTEEPNVPSIFEGLCCPELRKLNISHNIEIDDNGLVAIVKACPNLTHLSLVELEKLTFIGIRELARHCPGLQSVYFSRTTKGKALAQELQRLLPACKVFTGDEGAI